MWSLSTFTHTVSFIQIYSYCLVRLFNWTTVLVCVYKRRREVNLSTKVRPTLLL